jgi:hypothetical protein
VSLNDRRVELFEHILRLRRVERRHARDEDLAAVRAALEHQLGDTVSLRLAGRILGVSHTALRRWVDAGDLPRVINARGREEIPVGALIELRESVDGTRAAGSRSRHVLEPALLAGRERAQRLDAADVDEPTHDPDPHRRAQRRSLAYHRIVARRLGRSTADEALYTVRKWRNQGRLQPAYADRWEALLQRPLAEIRDAITEDSPDADDLRQTSPFAGVLSEPERHRLIELST